MMNLKKVSYEYYLKNSHLADIIVNCVDRKISENDIFCLIEFTNGLLFTIQYDIGILPKFKEIPLSSHMALSLNNSIYVIDLKAKKIIEAFNTITACESFELIDSELIVLCESEIIIYDYWSFKTVVSFSLPDMILDFKLSDNGKEIFIQLYDNTSVTIKKVGSDYQMF